MDFSALRPALATISSLVDNTTQTVLVTEQVEELRLSIKLLEIWPRNDPAFGRSRGLAACVWVSGIFSSPSKAPMFAERIVRECHFLLGDLDALIPEGESNSRCSPPVPQIALAFARGDFLKVSPGPGI